MNSRDESSLAAFASLFVHRWDGYALQQRNGSYWRQADALTIEHVHMHLRGLWTLGTYVLDTSSCCRFAVLDADQDDGLMALAMVANDLSAQGIPSVLEASRRGGHLWIHFVAPTPAVVVRAWLRPYADGLGIELYPKQDCLTPDGWGSLIRVPLGVHRRVRGWFPFVHVTPSYDFVPVAESKEDNCRWVIEHVQPVTVPMMEYMLPVLSAAETENGTAAGVDSARAAWHAPSGTAEHGGQIRAWSRAQDIVAVIGSYVTLDSRGIGSCPFKAHHHRGDLRPSFQVFGGDNPHWYCYTWRRAGDLFDFLCLYHGLTPQEGWLWLREGRFTR